MGTGGNRGNRENTGNRGNRENTRNRGNRGNTAWEQREQGEHCMGTEGTHTHQVYMNLILCTPSFSLAAIRSEVREAACVFGDHRPDDSWSSRVTQNFWR